MIDTGETNVLWICSFSFWFDLRPIATLPQLRSLKCPTNLYSLGSLLIIVYLSSDVALQFVIVQYISRVMRKEYQSVTAAIFVFVHITYLWHVCVSQRRVVVISIFGVFVCVFLCAHKYFVTSKRTNI